MLTNGVRISVLAGDWRTVRAYTLLAAVVDEAAFFGYDTESKVRSDTELIRAIKPGLVTTGGRLIAISSPYAKRGWCYKTHQQNFGNDTGRTLVWNCPSRTMNPTLPQSVVDDALADDLQAAKSEWLGAFREDIAAYIPRELVDRLVVKGRIEVPPAGNVRYHAFTDLSGGRQDDAALAIAHKQDRAIILDYLRRWKAPFNPHEVIIQMASDLERYGLRQVTGDNYAASFVSDAFQAERIRYAKSERSASDLYAEFLPKLCSGEVELLDNEALVEQLSRLERRTRSGGKDTITHPSGQHDDLANAVAGVSDVASKRLIYVGAMR